MIEALKRCLNEETGQGMTEYILIVTLVAIAAIAAFVFYRGALDDKVNGAAIEIQNS